MTHLQIVPFDIAVMLKEEGFDWNSFAEYHKGKLTFYKNLEEDHNGEVIAMQTYANSEPNHFYKEHTYSAPAVALALKWLRDVKKVLVEIGYSATRECNYEICLLSLEDKSKWAIIDFFDTNEEYEQAELAGLRKALEYLKEKKK